VKGEATSEKKKKKTWGHFVLEGGSPKVHSKEGGGGDNGNRFAELRFSLIEEEKGLREGNLDGARYPRQENVERNSKKEGGGRGHGS